MTQDLSLTGITLTTSLRKNGEEWSKECKSHVHTLNQIISVLYEGLESGQDKEEDNNNGDDFLSSLKLKFDRDEDIKLSLCSLFSQHCHSLISMLSKKTKGPVTLPLSSVIRLLTRCLKVSYSDVIALPSMSQLASHIPGLHQSCMDVLAQLILCCKRDLLPLSHVIIDLCLQTLTSSSKMDLAPKCRTKASVYQTLFLLIQTCGWGSYLKSHAKMLIQDLISNTKITEDTLKITSNKQESSSDSAFSKKRKGKKKRVNKAESYAELSAVNDAQRSLMMLSSDELHAVVSSLKFACLAVENLPFSSSHNLIRHLTDTAATIQKKSIDKPKPYHLVEVRTVLYEAIAACALSNLDYGCHRNDAFFHFQLTNSALHLLIAADGMETCEVKLVCSQALKNMESFGNVRGPVIRKILPSDGNDVEDLMELTRERDHLVDSNENLQTRLLDSEMENEQQSRLISTLQKELSNLRAEKSQWRLLSTSRDENLQRHFKAHQAEDTLPDGNEETGEEKEEIDESIIRTSQGNVHEITEEDKDVTVISVENFSSASVGCEKHVNESSMDENMEELGKEILSASKKRSNVVDDENELSGDNVKRHKQDTQDDTVQDMLLDFVDAPPDS